ncbi:hypothetical protein PR048_022972 [Dryococelus australis]|uniref:kynurenine--oxoglutarate transaminase n=1 Tax=Dryococelus australis TaxID=614101 RepID=A0ABQ9GSR5_9NEOP|nr:hypothetical protein PR048_022972 [Dryococelus australis]
MVETQWNEDRRENWKAQRKPPHHGSVCNTPRMRTPLSENFPRSRAWYQTSDPRSWEAICCLIIFNGVLHCNTRCNTVWHGYRQTQDVVMRQTCPPLLDSVFQILDTTGWQQLVFQLVLYMIHWGHGFDMMEAVRDDPCHVLSGIIHLEYCTWNPGQKWEPRARDFIHVPLGHKMFHSRSDIVGYGSPDHNACCWGSVPLDIEVGLVAFTRDPPHLGMLFINPHNEAALITKHRASPADVSHIIVALTTHQCPAASLCLHHCPVVLAICACFLLLYLFPSTYQALPPTTKIRKEKMLSVLCSSRQLARLLPSLSAVPVQLAVCNSATSAMSGEKFCLPERYVGSEKSVWVEYIQLALEHNPLNLGQGFPDYAPPDYVTKAIAEVAQGDNVLLHQYTRGFGHPRLVNVLAKLYSQLVGRQLNPLSEVLVTAGAYEALFATILGHTGPGDEVIIIEPFFDCYVPMVKAGQAIPRFIALKPQKKTSGVISSADWVLDPNELASLFNAKTKAIILNTPQNPLGKVFSRSELEMIADLCKKWNVLCVADEVYEWLVYKPNEHIRIATLPGMWERTITIGSAGKTFSVTGWKIGWAYGPAHLMKNLQTVHQNCVYTCSTVLQEAVARGFELEMQRLGQPECYFQSLAVELLSKRDFMAQFLSDVGMVPTIPEGGYFMVADWTALTNKVRLEEETDKNRDYRFTKWMTKNVKIQGIPPSAFYSPEHSNLGENYVRYCFIKVWLVSLCL